MSNASMRIYLYYNVKDYPYKIIPMFKVMKGEFPTRFEHVIVDSGVNRFFKYGCLKDYPRSYLQRYGEYARKLTRKYGDRIWIVVPDYPDDYTHNRINSNFEKMLDNIRHFLDKYPDVNWVVVIQARFMDYNDYEYACRTLRQVVGDYPRVAIGTLCTNASEEYAKFCCAIARKYFPNSWIHVFGPKVTWLTWMQHLVDSIDSVAYYSVPRHLRGRGKTYSHNECAYEWVKLAFKYLKRGQTNTTILDYLPRDNKTST